MPSKFHRVAVDINNYSPTLIKTDEQQEIVFGDMHGNTLKLLHILLLSGVIELSEASYTKFSMLYQKAYNDFEYLAKLQDWQYEESEILGMQAEREYQAAPAALYARQYMADFRFDNYRESSKELVPFEKSELDELNSIIDSIKLVNPELALTLLGDVFSDRGASDFFTIKLLTHLHNQGLSHRIIYSNHDLEFIWQFEHLKKLEPGKWIDDQEMMYRFQLDRDRHQGSSFHHLLWCLNHKIIDIKELDDFVKNIYYPNLKVIDYSLSEKGDEITLYSHASISLEQMKQAAREFGIVLDDSTPQTLALSIDMLNHAFTEILIKEEFSKLLKPDESRRGHTLYKTVWDRVESADDPVLPKRMTELNDYKICYVHGHNDKSNPAKRTNVFNLDDQVGKTLELASGELRVLLLNSIIPPILAASATDLHSHAASSSSSSSSPISAASSSSSSLTATGESSSDASASSSSSSSSREHSFFKEPASQHDTSFSLGIEFSSEKFKR